MKRNLDTFLYMPDKKTPMTLGGTILPLTMGLMISEATIGMYPAEDPQPDAKEKLMRFKLSVRCDIGGEQSFTQMELDCILRACNMKCGAWLYGQVAEWTEGKEAFSQATIESSYPQDVIDAAA